MNTRLLTFATKLGRGSVIGIPFAWLFLFFLLPFIIVLKISLSEGDYSPPYHAMLLWTEDQVSIVLNYYSYLSIIQDDEWSYLAPYLSMLKLAVISTIICVVLGYFIARFLVKLHNEKLQKILLWLIALPTILVIFLHGYASYTGNLLAPTGIINNFLLHTGIISEPLASLSSSYMIYLGVIISHVSLVIFPVFFQLNQREYSCDFVIQKIRISNLPKMQLIIGALLVFICVIGKYLIPNPLGFESFESSSYLTPYLNSLELAFFSTFFCLIIGYPMAYAIARAPKSSQAILLLLIVMPTWTALLIRVYAWMTILGNGNNGLLNQFLMGLGVISTPIEVLNTYIAVYIGVIYAYLPFMILPLYANLVKHDQSLLEAASDLGTKSLVAFWKITVPLSKNGIITGCMLVFIPIIGEFVIPELLGGSEYQLIGQTIYREYFSNNDWPRAAALAVIMLMLLIIPIQLFNRNQSKQLEAK